MKKIITGMKPTGEMLHLWNLLGALNPFQKVIRENDAAIMIADVHALTTVKDGEKMKAQTDEVIINYLSVLWDEEFTLFKQSDIHWIPKLAVILSNFTPLSLMLRAHSYKDSQNKKLDMNMGTFNYPILMAADILGYGIEWVPVGKDQKQHVEMARDIARYFNRHFDEEVFVEPQEMISEDVWVIPWLDGRKMSKSYGNFIGLFEDDATLKKKVMSIPTDSKWLEDAKDPETCHIFTLIKYFWTENEQSDIASKYRAGNYWYGHAKLALLDILIRYLTPYRERRTLLEQHPERIEKRLTDGAALMNERLDAVLARVKMHIGF